MSWERLVAAAREGRLFPAVILHGGSAGERRRRARELARVLLCVGPRDQRPCGVCSPCRRLTGETEEEPGHPDVHVLERDLKAATSIGATREFFRGIGLAPFEGAAQVFVVAEAESLRPDAADTLLKLLEEPPGTTPRHFLLLTPSRASLLPTVRSRCLAYYLGPGDALGRERVDGLAEEVQECLVAYRDTGAGVYLLVLAAVLEKGGGWADPRDRQPWNEVAAAILRCAQDPALDPGERRALLALAQDLLEAHRWRERGVTPTRILEGLVARRLARLPV